MEDKKNELELARGAMGVTEFALLYFPDCTPEMAYKSVDFPEPERPTIAVNLPLSICKLV